MAFGIADQAIDDPIVVLFDEGHGQFFNRSLYSQAISDLISKEIEVVFNTGKINNTSFEGVDIFISTNPQVRYTRDESIYVNRFITQGNAIFLLANPLNEDNETLTGRGDIFNEFLGYLENGFLMGKFWTYYKVVDDITPSNVVLNEFSNIGASNYLHLKPNTSNHAILNINKNVTSIITYTCSLEDASQNILVATPEAVAKTISGEFSETGGLTTDIILFGSSGDDLKTGARVLLSGSSLMFSDLKGPIENYSWYESENNSLLWLNSIEWLAATKSEPLPPYTISEQDLIQMLIFLGGFAIIFFLCGSIAYLIGSGRKILIIKSEQSILDEPVSQAAADQTGEPLPAQSKESRRDRRLRQIKKGQRGRRR